MIHTPLGKIDQISPRGWYGYLEIAPRTEACGPEHPIKRIEARSYDSLMKKMLSEARLQMGLLGTMILWAENQEWARRKRK